MPVMIAHLPRAFAALAPALLLTACATPIVDGPAPLTEGTPVSTGQAVTVGRLVAMPVKVDEDSRCPMNARCVQAGKLIVTTRIDGAGWRETVPLTLGTVHETHGTTVMLSSGTPERMAGAEGPDGATHFTFEGGK